MPNNDYIKRSDALDAIRGTSRWCIDAVEKIPAADVEPVRRWIPVTERLPELNKEVLVYAIGKVDGIRGKSAIEITERFLFRLFPISEGREEWRSPWQYFLENYEITHWMPLPEPPKGEDDG